MHDLELIKEHSSLLLACLMAGLTIKDTSEVFQLITGITISHKILKNHFKKIWKNDINTESQEVIEQKLQLKKIRRKPINRQKHLSPYLPQILSIVDKSNTLIAATKSVNQLLSKEKVQAMSYDSLRRLVIKAKGGTL